MVSLEKKMAEIALQLQKGVTPKKVTVRDILKWIGVSRRGSNVNWRIKRALEKAGLDTKPDFDWAYLHSYIEFVPIESDKSDEQESTTYQIGALESANRKPVSIKPDSTLAEAITVMLTRDFSQIPVMTSDRELKGAISWKSIGSKLSLGKKCAIVRECMDKALKIDSDFSLFKAIDIIAEHDYVLVQAHDKTICGIVTASDLSQQFRDLAEPFLLIGECENFVRRLIHGKFQVEELVEASNPDDSSRKVEGVADLTFGEYIRLLEEKKRWAKIGLAVDRKEFIKQLNKVREIRNDVMHFDPQGVEPEALEALQEFVRFLHELWRLSRF